MIVLNKIYKAFDSIKIDDNIKKKIYDEAKIKIEKNKKFKLLMLGYVPLIFLIAITLMISDSSNQNKFDGKENGNDYNITSIQEDVFIYENNIYSLQLENTLEDIIINKKIGTLNKVEFDSILVNNFDSYYHDGYSVYSTNYKDILIVKSDIETFIYQIQK